MVSVQHNIMVKNTFIDQEFSPFIDDADCMVSSTIKRHVSEPSRAGMMPRSKVDFPQHMYCNVMSNGMMNDNISQNGDGYGNGYDSGYGNGYDNQIIQVPAAPNSYIDDQITAQKQGLPVVQLASPSANNNSQAAPVYELAANAIAAANGVMNPSLSWDNIYTVMLRNLPNKVDQQSLLSELDSSGFANAYDFVHVPLDPDTKANRGYAFINFVTPSHALMFRLHFDGRKFSSSNSQKVMSVVPATLQGYEKNFNHYTRGKGKPRGNGAQSTFFSKPGAGANLNGKQKQSSLIDQARGPYVGDVPRNQPNQLNGIQNNNAGNANKVPRFCGYCGEGFEYKPNVKFCQFCGKPVLHA